MTHSPSLRVVKKAKALYCEAKTPETAWHIISSDFAKKLFAVHFYDEQNGIAAGSDYKIYFTSDGGSTWSEYWFNSFPSTEFQVTLRSIYFLNDSTGFICGGENFDKGIILRTNNKGINWTFYTYDHELRDIHMNNAGTAYCAGYGILLESRDRGENWYSDNAPAEFYTGLTSDQVRNIVCGYNGHILTKELNAAVWKGEKAGSAFRSVSYFNSVCNYTSDIIYAVGDDGAFAESSNGGSSFKLRSGGSKTNLNKIEKGAGNGIFVVGDDGYLATVKP